MRFQRSLEELGWESQKRLSCCTPLPSRVDHSNISGESSLIQTRSGAGIAGAQTIHANVYATQVSINCQFMVSSCLTAHVANCQVCDVVAETAHASRPHLWQNQNLLWSVCSIHLSLISGCSFGCRTEPNTGLETLKLRTFAKKEGDSYSISGQKMSVVLSPCLRKMQQLTVLVGYRLLK